MPDREKIEFIESYVKIGNSDYQWNDNHGELIRCRACQFYPEDGICMLHSDVWKPDGFCSCAIKKGGQ